MCKKLNVNGTRGHSLKLEKMSCARDEKVILLTQSSRGLECFWSTHGGCT